MDITVTAYLVYLAISVPAALWVGWTLHRNGRVFLVEIFEGKEDLADSINHLLVVGFYLVTIGFVSIALRFGVDPDTTSEAFESVSTQVGVVLLVLGVLHLLNLLALKVARSRVLELAAATERLRMAPASAGAQGGAVIPNGRVCPKCGTANDPKTNFCVGCGGKIG